MRMQLEDLRILQMAEVLADSIWQQVIRWQPLPQDVVGKQIARAADSVGANIAEAFGRYHFGERLQFLYYARGSLFETKYWLNRASARQLITADVTQSYVQQVTDLARKLNAFASTTKQQRTPAGTAATLREPDPVYGEFDDFPLSDFPLFTDFELEWLETFSSVEAPF